MARILQGIPHMCVTTTAFVRGVIEADMASGDMLPLSKVSQKIGTILNCIAGELVAWKL